MELIKYPFSVPVHHDGLPSAQIPPLQDAVDAINAAMGTVSAATAIEVLEAVLDNEDRSLYRLLASRVGLSNAVIQIQEIQDAATELMTHLQALAE